VIRDLLPLFVDVNEIVAGFERDREGIFEDGAGAFHLPAEVSVLRARIAEDINQSGSKRSGTSRPVGNQFEDRSGIKSAGVRPGVDLLSSGHSHL
jgi:hypothetical protein